MGAANAAPSFNIITGEPIRTTGVPVQSGTMSPGIKGMDAGAEALGLTPDEEA